MAAGDNYTIPLGIDPRDFFKGLNDIDTGLDGLQLKAVQTNKDMQSSFNNTATAGEKLGTTLQNVQSKAAVLADQAKNMGKQLGDALSGKGFGDGLNSKIDAVRKKLASAAETAIFVDVNFDNKKIDLLQTQIRAASSAAEEFNVILEFSKQQLAAMEPGSQSYTTLANRIQTAEEFIDRLNQAAASTIPTARALTDQFDQLFNDPGKFLAANELEKLNSVVDGSANEVQRLSGIIDLLNEKLSTLNPNSNAFQELQAVVNAGTQALQAFEQTTEQLEVSEGAAATTTTSLRSQLRQMREELANLELTGQGNTERFRELAQSAGELQDQIGDTGQRIRAFASDTKYLDAGISAVQGLVGGFTAAQGAIALFGVENEKTQAILVKVTGAMAVLQGIQALANTLNKDSAFSVILLSRARAADTAAATGQAAATTEVAAAEGAATVATEGLTAALLLNPITLVTVAIIAAVSALILYANATDDATASVERFNRLADAEKDTVENQIKNLERLNGVRVAYAKLAGAKEAEITGITTKNLQEQIKARTDYGTKLNAQLKELNQKRDEDKIDEEDYGKALEKISKARIENQEAIYDLDNKIQIAGIDARTQHNKEMADQRKKDIEDQKKAAQQQKAIADQILKFTKELNSGQLAAMEDGADKQRAQARSAAKQQIDALNSEVSLSKKATKLRADAIVAINKGLAAEIKKIDENEANERLERQLNFNGIMAGLQRDGLKKSLDMEQADFEAKKHDIELQFKDEAELRDKLLKALALQNQQTIKDITQEARQQQLNLDQEGEELTLELMSKYAISNKGVEEQKQIELLKIKLKYAQLGLDAIVDDGTQETDVRKKQAQKTINDLNQQLNQAVTAQNTQGMDWFKVLGLGDLTDEQQQAVTEAAEKSLESISVITDFIVSQYQRQIDKKQELIDEYDRQIDDLEQNLDREKELQSQGLANNVAAIEAELAAKQKAKDDEMKQIEELQKKQQAAQRVQMAIDTVSQTVNLVTAATSIFKSLAGIPFVGIPLAIATVALMTGAFVAAKAKAFSAVGDGAQKFKMGGWIEGKSHERGGQKYYSIDGSGGVKELEDGEHVTSKEQAAKYPDLLEAINSGGIESMGDDALRELLAGMGISMSTDAPKSAMVEVVTRDEARGAIITMGSGSKELEGIKQDVAYLAERKRNDVDRWEDDKYFYEKKGDKLTKIRK